MNIIREKRDLYDANRNLTKKTVFKGEPIPKGNYIVVVLVFIQNSEGKFFRNNIDEFDRLLDWLENKK